MKIMNYFSMLWKMLTTMSASSQYQFYKAVSVIICFLIPFGHCCQHSNPNTKKGTRGGDLSHLECQSRIAALSSDLCPSLFSIPA